MTSPTQYDDVRRESIGFGENSFNRRVVHDHYFDIGPALREHPPCTFGCHLCVSIERFQENRPPVFRPRNDRPNARASRPGKTCGSGDRRSSLLRAISRNQHPKLCASSHTVDSWADTGCVDRRLAVPLHYIMAHE
jgi:hypothetical protein